MMQCQITFRKFCKRFFCISCMLFLLSSCKYYHHNKLFTTDEEIIKDSLHKKVKYAKRNYVIQKDDYITLDVYTNNGEKLIDPQYQMSSGQNQQSTGNKGLEKRNKYLVQSDGTVDLPMIGNIALEDYTLKQADSLLAEKYQKFYKEVFVKTRILNKRVILMGALGSDVIKLENENMNLIEVLAMANNKGRSGGNNRRNPKYYNIRLIRGNLNDPSVYKIDLTSIEGMKQANLSIEPNDIIYVEPYRKAALEGLRDFNPVFGLINSMFTLFILVNQLSR